MLIWKKSLLIVVAVYIFLAVPGVLAALNFSDHISTVLPSIAANHDLQWTVADAGGIAEGESFTIEFASQFNTSSITVNDVDIFDDGGDLTLAGDCSGSEKISLSLVTADVFVFTICPAKGGAIAANSIVNIKIGTNANGGTQQIINPIAGTYWIDMIGTNGYDDDARTQVAIVAGTSVSAYFAGPTGDLRIIGYASPNAMVFFLENGAVEGTQSANSNSYFDKTLSGLEPGIHIISIYGTDSYARNTLTITFSVNIISGSTTIASGIILPPTMSAVVSEVKRPASLIAVGAAKNNASVQVFISGSGDNQSTNYKTNNSGNWSAELNPKLHLGNKNASAIALDGLGGQSEFSSVASYNVLLSADLNVDNLVNLNDFSILMFNYGTSNPPNVLADINDNGPVDLVDFSVMMYGWTGG